MGNFAGGNLASIDFNHFEPFFYVKNDILKILNID